MNLLVTSAGRRNQLLNCFREDAKRLKVDLRVLAADANPAWSPACQEADAAFQLPACTRLEFVPALLDLCQKQKVRILVPTIDPELAVLSRHRSDFAAIGTRVIVSAPEVVALAGDKLATAARLMECGIPTPRTVSLADYLDSPAQWKMPVIAKPRAGSAGKGIILPKHPGELAGLDPSGYIVQDFWKGREFTVNVFFDKNGRLRSAVPHQRIEVRAGEVSKGITRRVPQLADAADKLTVALPGAIGPLCFQAILKDTGEFSVFEINARFGGGFPLAHHAGARFTQWLLEEERGLSMSARDDWDEGVIMLRFDAAVFLHD